jgi:D-amino-acid oxidase
MTEEARGYSRRSALKLISMSAVAYPILGACSTLGTGTARTQALPRGRRLAPVMVSPDRVIRHVVGLRPFRRSGFNVSVQQLDNKPVIHNYGHGGSGITLSWGTAHLALQHALATPHRDVAVIGCGAVGLATARLLQDHGFSVTIYARDLPPNTTSNIAGASWAPTGVADAEHRTPAFDEQFAVALRFAFRYFQTLVSPRYGISWRETYYLSEREDPRLGAPVAQVADFRPPAVLLAPWQHAFGPLYAGRVLTMHIEPSVYLQTVLTDFRLSGGRIVVRDFANAQAIAALPHPLVVNCSGLGAAALFNDTEMMPVKGQLTVLAPQPEVDYITIGPTGNLYMMPRHDGIVLGGTNKRGDWSLEPDPKETTRIMQAQKTLFAQMNRTEKSR